jgi:hypothetical protein
MKRMGVLDFPEAEETRVRGEDFSTTLQNNERRNCENGFG